MSDLPAEIVVHVDPPAPDVVYEVEALPEIRVTVSEVGLVGPQGPAGPAGQDGVDTGVDPVPLIDEHINSPAPHPVYDDGPSLILLYQNAKV